MKKYEKSLILVEKNIKLGKYNEAIKKIKIIFNTSNREAETLIFTMKLISSVQSRAGLEIILKGIRESLFQYLFRNFKSTDLHLCLQNIGFVRSAKISHVNVLCTHLVSYFANKAYELDLIDIAFWLESEIYDKYITRNETEKAFGHGMSLTKDAALAAGETYRERLGPLNTNFQNQKPIVGFFFHNASMLAHIENIHSYLSAAHEKGFKEFTPILFCLGGRNFKFEENFKNIGVEIVYLDVDDTKKPILSMKDRFQYMRKKCQELRVDKIVWGCLALYMPFVYSMRLANEQIWWSQKWQNFNCRIIDKYIWSFGMNEREPHYGQEWLCGWFQRKKWLQNIPVFDIMVTRGEFHGKLILGSLARAEKISDPRYLDAICKILKKNDNIIYLWAGRAPAPFVTDYFLSEGVYNKTKFIGWVNTDIYARVLDIMLDTFPAGNGVTAIQTMGAGKPVVIFKSSDSIRTLDLLIGTSGIKASDQNEFVQRTEQIFAIGPEQTESLYTCAETVEQYITLANELIEDPALRSRVGDAFKKFVDEFMCSPDIAERKFTHHILSN